MTEPTTWADWQLFGDERAYHSCCECCDGYCPVHDSKQKHVLPEGAPLRWAEINGRGYLTDQYLAILEDRVRAECGDPSGRAKPLTWEIPAGQSPLTTALLAAHYVHWLTDCGLTVHEGDGPLERQHVYSGGEHIGWLMPVKEIAPYHMALADINRVRTLAGNLPLPVSMDPWDAAAILINAIPTITDTREKAATP